MTREDLDLKSLNRWLDQFLNFERRPDKNMLNLSTMRLLCDFFHHPESTCPAFHVAGSKGKGTISADIAAILSATERQGTHNQVGIYASPHVLHFTERVSLNGHPFPPEIYAAAEQELKSGIARLLRTQGIEKSRLTWYELTTIFAMLVFREAKVDYAVYEVGMGGRLDATNIITPACVALGPIELEHTEFLGDTLEKIAAEKAGVFKDGVPVVSAPQKPEVRQVFDAVARKHHTAVTYVSDAAGENYEAIDAAVASAAVEKVVPGIPAETIKQALASVHLPGRYEILSPVPGYPGVSYLLMDVAHTENSIRAVLERLKADGRSGELLFGCARDKNVEEIAAEIYHSGLFRQIHLTRPGDFKKSDLPRMEQAFRAAGFTKIIASPDYQSFIKETLNAADAKKSPLVVLGSFYLVGEVQKVLEFSPS